jgi:2-keto-4-pentenoate hydratase
MPLSNAIRSDLADEVHRTRGVLTKLRPFSQRHAGFGLEDAYWIVEEMRRKREAAGDIVTTGTLTAAFAARPGQRWRAESEGVAIGEIGMG